MDKPRSREHLGHLFMDCTRKNPNVVCQIDAATGEQETNESVLFRSIRLAKCLRNFGLKPGDIISLGGRNHLDLFIPLYAGLLNGLPISGVDPYFKYDEIKSLFTITKPKIAFCQQESCNNYIRVLKDIGIETKIVTFDGKDNNLQQFIEEYGDDEPIDNFEPTDFDAGKIYAFLTNTSGTSGGLKVAALTHETVLIKLKMFGTYIALGNSNSRDHKITLNLSPIQWLSAYLNALLLLLGKHARLQTSRPDDVGHVIDMINKYKPTSCIISPALMMDVLDRKDEVDLTCFQTVNITGSKAYSDALMEFQGLLREDARVMEPYGLSETVGPITIPTPKSPFRSVGVVVSSNVVKLVDPDSGKEITEPYVTGELWTKGPSFTEYYNDPEATAAMFTEDGFLKTGDLLYRDENGFYFFVDRIKSLIKYRNSHVLPEELESVILTHPGVHMVCVCGVPHREDGQRPAACIVRKPACHVTEQEIKELVASKLSKYKQLHGGVVFVDQMPMTSSGKVAKGKVLDILKKSTLQ